MAPKEAPRDASDAASGASSGPLIVGVLGGIAAGKSAVARLLAGRDGVVLSADELAREALDSPPVRSRVRERFGPGAIAPDGRVDRAFLARAVFDPEGGAALRSELESWTHPLVRDRIMERLSAARAAGVPRVVLDVPLLLENDAQHGLARLCDVLVFVEVRDDERERRARRERGWAGGELARREVAQLPLAEKKARAHHVIENNQGFAELEQAVDCLLAELRGGRTQR
jgi:dephospho-CoA kinase